MHRFIRAVADRLVEAVIRRAMKTPYFHLPEYMNRYWLLKPRRWTFGCAIRVHQILRSDNDRHLHDHPWPFATLILRGGYVEILQQHVLNRSELFDRIPCPEGLELIEWHSIAGSASLYLKSFGRTCRPGRLIFHRATSRHRLILPPGRHAWTLFFMGPKRQTWGFYTERGKVPWHEYLPSAEATWQRAEHRAHGIAE